MTDDNKPIALEDRASEEDRLFSPSAARNRDVIWEAFIKLMPPTGTIWEVGSGTGEHCVHIASVAKGLNWWPSDPDPQSRRSIAAWARDLNLQSVLAPLEIDVTRSGWTTQFKAVGADAPVGIVSINMIHIAPFEAAKGLISGAGEALTPGGRLFLYGPFSRDGQHTAPSNADFDASLKSRDPSWGVRDLERDIMPLARQAGLAFVEAIAMPANNLSVVFEQS
ncbi:MAG: DUF938 domain-containing protein [Pseudomonadota bacterium]